MNFIHFICSCRYRTFRWGVGQACLVATRSKTWTPQNNSYNAADGATEDRKDHAEHIRTRPPAWCCGTWMGRPAGRPLHGCWWYARYVMSALRKCALTNETEDLQPEIEDDLYKTSALAKELSQVCPFFKTVYHQSMFIRVSSGSRTKLNEPNVSQRWPRNWKSQNGDHNVLFLPCRMLQLHLCNVLGWFLNVFYSVTGHMVV